MYRFTGGGFGVLIVAALSSGGCKSTPSGTPDASKPLGFAASNVDLTGIDLSKVGDFVVDNDACTIDTNSNLASCGDGANVLAFKIAKQSDGSKVAVYVAKSMNVLAGKNLTVTGSLPFVFIALGTIRISGTLNANSKADVAVAGGQEVTTQSSRGAGPGGGNTGTATAAPGGGSYCGAGGAGAVESGTPTSGSVAYGSPTIRPLVGGSSGGAGSGGAGSGGGAVQLVAGTSITIDATGLIQVGGGGGGFGGISGQQAGAGGSGGSLLLESTSINVAGALAANGGGGGAGTAMDVGALPPLDPSGANSTPSSTAAAGGKAGIGPSSGGDGSAAASVNGTAGSFTAGNSAGGGGGGAGRIRLNTKTGVATISGTISPATSTPCATQGTVG
ncbi:MAG TPA: hypothetical protein VLM85_02485 [Polyangiaceae bacterium]|nr:hypothetical protein [Polyangiaceae bacterium]